MGHKVVTTLLKDVTTATTGKIDVIGSGIRTLHATISGTGTVSGTVEWYGSNIQDNSTGVLLATSGLSGTDKDNAGAVITAEYYYMWAKVTTISAGAKISAAVSV